MLPAEWKLKIDHQHAGAARPDGDGAWMRRSIRAGAEREGQEAMNREMMMRFKTLFEEQRKHGLVYSRRVINPDFHLNQDDLADEVDLTSSETETSMRIRLRNREALYMKKIEEALRRIADGSFGLCEECGDEIELRRMEARPTTTFCVACKEARERTETLHIDGHRFKSLGRAIRMRSA